MRVLAEFHLPWREICHQLRQFGDIVDTSWVPVTWTTESSQMVKLCTILEEAGFQKKGLIYRWK
jgi:hypothetical protein